MSLPETPIAPSALLLIAIVGAAILVYAPFVLVGYARFQTGYDQTAPRSLLDKLPPYAQRATWAHENAFESFILFSAAALMAYVTEVTAPLAGWVAIAYLVARTFYPVFYIANIPLARSLMFGIGSLSIATLFTLSLQQVL